MKGSAKSPKPQKRELIRCSFCTVSSADDEERRFLKEGEAVICEICVQFYAECLRRLAAGSLFLKGLQ